MERILKKIVMSLGAWPFAPLGSAIELNMLTILRIWFLTCAVSVIYNIMNSRKYLMTLHIAPQVYRRR